MKWLRWLGLAADDWPPPTSPIGGEFRLAADPYFDAAWREPLRLLSEAAATRQLVVHPNVPMELVLRPLGRPRERSRRHRQLQSLRAGAVAFDAAAMTPGLVILFTAPGLPRGKRPTEDRWRRVLLGTNLPLVRWPLQLPATPGLAGELLETGMLAPTVHAPACRRCGAATLRRAGKSTPEAPFWGCSSWPSCGWTSPWTG
ncbi:hypothetical protein GC173_00060 [bacterium]|nr:hypothetical protein [bacterium]